MHKHLILASASPARKNLLVAAGLELLNFVRAHGALAS
jgi:predicted house-cleaning NTP pyrophosphatase (Maf/HAM1 superfamily)